MIADCVVRCPLNCIYSPNMIRKCKTKCKISHQFQQLMSHTSPGQYPCIQTREDRFDLHPFSGLVYANQRETDTSECPAACITKANCKE